MEANEKDPSVLPHYLHLLVIYMVYCIRTYMRRTTSSAYFQETKQAETQLTADEWMNSNDYDIVRLTRTNYFSCFISGKLVL